jgi:acetamidase/formamidase
MTLPSDIQVTDGSPLCTYQELQTACAFDPLGTSIRATGPFIISPAPENALIEVDIINIRNPRSMKTTGVFVIQSFDSNGFLIDYYSEPNTAVTMAYPATIT